MYKTYHEHPKYLRGVYKPFHELLELAEAEGKNRIYHVLSFGGGTQSSHLLEAHFRGELHYDYIVFSDTGAEPQFIHEQVEWWRNRQKEVGNTTPFIITRHTNMERGLEEMLMRYIFTDYERFQMPLYFNKTTEEGNIVPGGLMPRQCTAEFKIIPVQKAVRSAIKEELGLSPQQRMPKNIGIFMDIGFSFDEVNRISGHVSHQSSYIYLNYPLVEQSVSTKDSIDFLVANNFPTRRSRCYFCPFNCSGDRARDIGMDWLEIITEEPLSFLKACYFDEQLRSVQATGTKRMKSIPYFHYSRTPLREFYQAEYDAISSLYDQELVLWEQEWKTYLANLYQMV